MTRKRFIIYVLLFTMTLINYFDRTVLSIAMPVVRDVFALSPVAVGYLLSARTKPEAPVNKRAALSKPRSRKQPTRVQVHQSPT